MTVKVVCLIDAMWTSKRFLQCFVGAIVAGASLAACSTVIFIEDSSGASSSTAASSGGTGGSAATSATGPGGSPASSTAGGEPPPADEAVAFQINAWHTGAVENDTLTPPLTTRWTVDLGAVVSYPLIAGGRVFVTIGSTKVAAKLVALDQKTGKTLWGPVELGGVHAMSHAAYDDGKVFTLNSDGQLRAFEAPTGNELWSLQLPTKGGPFTSSPTAYGGKIFISGEVDSSQFFAVDQATGTMAWSRIEYAATSWNPPVISATAAYFACRCGAVCGFDRATGEPIWPPSLEGCGSTDANDAMLFEGRFYIRDVALSTDVILDAKTREKVGSFWNNTRVAFHNGRAFVDSKDQLIAWSTPELKQLWALPGDGSKRSRPIVVNGRVYFLTSATEVVAVDEQTGAPVWTWYLNLGQTFDVGSDDAPRTALAAGGGALLVPWGNFLVALW